MILLGLIGKAGAVFVSLPDPIIAGMFLFIFPLIMAVGISTLAEVSLESARNVFIVSFSIFMGLVSFLIGSPKLFITQHSIVRQYLNGQK